MRSDRRRWLSARVAGLALVALVACGPACDSGGDTLVAEAKAVQLARAEAARLESGDGPAAARVRLEEALAQLPDGDGAALTALRQDLRFALGALSLRAGAAPDALAEADRGLALPRTDRPSLFVARLHALRGLALEALGRADEAVAALAEAQAMHARLFDELLSRRPPETTP